MDKCYNTVSFKTNAITAKSNTAQDLLKFRVMNSIHVQCCTLYEEQNHSLRLSSCTCSRLLSTHQLRGSVGPIGRGVLSPISWWVHFRRHFDMLLIFIHFNPSIATFNFAPVLLLFLCCLNQCELCDWWRRPETANAGFDWLPKRAQS